jgi:pyruvate dehydrogenase E2 component (dihydrolipoamide acetyltransferase)
MIGGMFANLVIVPPQVAIVGAGRIFQRLVFENNEIVSRAFLPLSLTFDHRVVTGGEATRFMMSLKKDLELDSESSK